jgi:hypothetical protein
MKSHFSINLQNTNKEEPDNIGLHISVRWNDKHLLRSSKAIVRNDKKFGSWGVEERDVSHFPFRAGEPFEMFIQAGFIRWEVIVNNNTLFTFLNREGFSELNHVGISGDVSIQTIDILKF